MNDHQAFYSELADKILLFWNNEHEEDALRALRRACATAASEGSEALQSLLGALLERRVHRSSAEVLGWLDTVLQQFHLIENKLPEMGRRAVSTFVSIHLDHFAAFEARGTIANIKQKIDYNRYNPESGPIDWRQFKDETVRSRMMVLNVFNPQGLESIIGHLDSLDGERTRKDLENGLATPESWDTIDPAKLPANKDIEEITESALDRMITACVTLKTSPSGLAPQAQNSPERFSLFTRLAALTWMMDINAFRAARDSLDPQVFWPAMAAALRMRKDSPVLNEIMREIGKSGAGPLMLKNCDPRTAYNYSREVKIVNLPEAKPPAPAPVKPRGPQLPSKPTAPAMKRK